VPEAGRGSLPQVIGSEPWRAGPINCVALKGEIDMAMNQNAAVVGVFQDRAQAERAVDDLKRAGFNDEQIGFVARDGSGDAGATETTNTGEGTPGGGAVGGAVGGGILGGILGAAAALLIPGIGPIVAGGILAAALGGAAIGAVAGGLIGALTDMGVPEEEAQYYDQEFRSGRTIVTVQAGNRREEAMDILRRDGAYDASNRGADMTAYDTTTAGNAGAYDTAAGGAVAYDTTRNAGAYDTTAGNAGTYNTETTTQTTTQNRAGMSNTGVDTDQGNQRIELREEQLTPTKQAVQAGEVQVNKVVREEQQQVPVTLRHEEVRVERHAVDQPLQAGDIGDIKDETINVPIYEEQAQLQKQGRVREEVTLHKDQVEEQQTLTGTTRREELDVDSTGDARIRGDENIDAGMQQNYDQTQRNQQNQP